MVKKGGHGNDGVGLDLVDCLGCVLLGTGRRLSNLAKDPQQVRDSAHA